MVWTPTLTLIFVIIGLALLFDFLNGFHDAANSVATVVTTRVLSPLQAVFWAAFSILSPPLCSAPASLRPSAKTWSIRISSTSTW
jgi:hypothetical protein